MAGFATFLNRDGRVLVTTGLIGRPFGFRVTRQPQSIDLEIVTLNRRVPAGSFDPKSKLGRRLAEIAAIDILAPQGALYREVSRTP